MKGHADNEWNNRCDELAREAITDLKNSLSPEELLELEMQNKKEDLEGELAE